MSRSYRVYGVTVAADYDLSPFLPTEDGDVDLVFECTEAPPPDPPGKVRLVYDRNSIRIVRYADSTRLEFADSTVHVVTPDRIICHLLILDHDFLVPIQLLGMVMATWLEQHGRLALHGSAVEIDGSAAIFLASGKAGKTSIAAELCRRGAPLLTEDLVSVARDDAGFAVHPGYPLMRMWPDAASHFLGDAEGLELYHPRLEKLWVPVDRLGSFARTPAPIGSIYLPERVDTTVVEVEDVAPLEAVKAVLAGSFLAEMIEPAADAARRLEIVSELVESVPVKRIWYPQGYSRLDQLREAIGA